MVSSAQVLQDPGLPIPFFLLPFTEHLMGWDEPPLGPLHLHSLDMPPLALYQVGTPLCHQTSLSIPARYMLGHHSCVKPRVLYFSIWEAEG